MISDRRSGGDARSKPRSRTIVCERRAQLSGDAEKWALAAPAVLICFAGVANSKQFDDLWCDVVGWSCRSVACGPFGGSPRSRFGLPVHFLAAAFLALCCRGACETPLILVN
jgi:hypothetical protein